MHTKHFFCVEIQRQKQKLAEQLEKKRRSRMEALADKQEQERDAFSNESETIKSGDALVHVRPVTLYQDTSLCMTLLIPGESCTVRYPGQGSRGSCIVLAKWQYNNNNNNNNNNV